MAVRELALRALQEVSADHVQAVRARVARSVVRVRVEDRVRREVQVVQVVAVVPEADRVRVAGVVPRGVEDVVVGAERTISSRR